MPILRDWTLAVDVDSVLRNQGADPAAMHARCPEAVEVAGRALEEGLALAQPAVLYRQFAIEAVRGDDVRLEGGALLSGAPVAARLKPARHVIAAVCTVGSALVNRSDELFAIDPAHAMALDALGSAAVTALAFLACRFFDARAADAHMQATNPLGPGAAGWPLQKGQRQVFALLDAASIGVELASSGLMRPRKSISMIVGVGPDVPVDENRRDGSPCEVCNLRETCRYRGRYRDLHHHAADASRLPQG